MVPGLSVHLRVRPQAAFSDVELEFFAFEDVTVASTALARSGRDSGKESTLSELFDEVGSNFGLLLSLGEFDLGALGSL